jgi:hypothetical protein
MINEQAQYIAKMHFDGECFIEVSITGKKLKKIKDGLNVPFVEISYIDGTILLIQTSKITRISAFEEEFIRSDLGVVSDDI